MSAPPSYEVVLYATGEEGGPVEDFLNDLPTKDRAKCDRLLNLLRQQGPALRFPKTRKVAGLEDMWELRTQGKSAYRLYYTPLGERRYCVLGALNKKTNDIPSNVLDTLRTRQQRVREIYSIEDSR